ncbi:MAG: hypothetical protein COW08_00300 [Ignavibacteriales bacterium CG12_big_fil_rev_8_21_14_0_65_30_8]|nr:MAG: hypothetical protein COW08_00300 [Ignavibacteriales bacterium CG12_big_fil_rev_8_21_14_0_65_30_8]
MKKYIALFALCFFFVGFNSANAQVKAVINGGVQIPTGDFKNSNDVGYGGSIDAEFNVPLVGPTFFVSTGYNRWTISNTDYNNSIIPLMGGIKYFFGTPGGIVTLYFGGALGMAILNDNTPLSDSQSKFIWSPSIGVRFSNLDINAKYQSISSNGFTYSWYGLNIGFVIGR